MKGSLWCAGLTETHFPTDAPLLSCPSTTCCANRIAVFAVDTVLIPETPPAPGPSPSYGGYGGYGGYGYGSAPSPPPYGGYGGYGHYN